MCLKDTNTKIASVTNRFLHLHNELIRKITSSPPFGNNDINAAFAAAFSALLNVGKYSRLS